MKKIILILVAMLMFVAVPAYAGGGKPNKYSTCLAGAWTNGTYDQAKAAECARLYVDCTKMVTTKIGNSTVTACKQI
jgi:hypothetical protein